MFKHYRLWAKMGYAARGVIYVSIGLLAFSSAMGWGGNKSGSKGAILAIRNQPFGELALVILAIGLVGYVTWRLIQAITDTDDHGKSIDGLVVRGSLIVSAVSHSVLTYWVIATLLRISKNSSDASASITLLRYLDADIVPFFFGAIGLALLGVGFAHLYKGVTSRFEKYIDFLENNNRWLIPICQFGLVSRGVVWCITGWIILRSAFVVGYSETKGISDVFRWLSTTPYGTGVTIVIAIGLFSFGVYGFVESFYRRIEK